MRLFFKFVFSFFDLISMDLIKFCFSEVLISNNRFSFLLLSNVLFIMDFISSSFYLSVIFWHIFASLFFDSLNFFILFSLFLINFDDLFFNEKSSLFTLNPDFSGK